MTRPRAYQINDPSTRYQRYVFRVAPVPGDGSTTINNAGPYFDYDGFVASGTTGVVDGCEEIVPATIIGTVQDPIGGLSAGDKFALTLPGVNYGQPMVVEFQSGDFVSINAITPATTAERVAARINAVTTSYGVTVPVASRTPDGTIRIDSADTTGYTVGASATLKLTTVTAGVLFTLGLAGSGVSSITATGSDRVRGIVTKSRDRLGGHAFPHFEYGRRVTQNSKVFRNFGLYNNTYSSVQDIPSGQPLYGRVSRPSPTSIRFDWKARVLAPVEVRSKFSDFSSISSETFQLQFFDTVQGAQSALTVTFPGSVSTVTDVADAFNNSWDSEVDGMRGVAQCFESEPYAMPSGIIQISVDGGVAIPVTFDGLERSAAEVALKINTALSPNATSSDLSGRVVIKTFTALGETSSIDVLSSSEDRILRVLGLPVGKYVGSKICFVDGAEIVIRPPSRTTMMSQTAAVGTILTKLGISGQIPAVPAFQAVVPTEFPTVWPDDMASQLLSVPSSFSASGTVSVMFSEYMEAGDVADDSCTVDMLEDNVAHSDFPFLAYGSSAAMSGVVADPYGRIRPEQVPTKINGIVIGNTRFSEAYSPDDVKRIVTYDDTSCNLQTEFRSSTPSNLKVVREFVNDTGSDVGYELTVNARRSGSQYLSDENTLDSSLVRLDRDSYSISGSLPSVPAFSFPSAQAGWRRSPTGDFASSVFESFVRDGVFREVGSREMWLTDPNVFSANPTKKVPLSSGTATRGDACLRIGGKESSLSGTQSSLIFAANARAHVTCGDGVSTFGDFNGTDALLAAANFLASQGITGASVHLKKGSYVVSGTVAFADKNIDLSGEPGTTVDISVSAHTISFSSSSGTHRLTVSGLTITNMVSGKQALHVGDGGSVVATGCSFNDVHLDCADVAVNPIVARFDNCVFSGVEDSVYLLHKSGSPSVLFNACLFKSTAVDVGMVTIAGRAATSPFKFVKFSSCVFIPGAYTTSIDGTTGLPVCTKNTGILNLDPGNDGRSAAGLDVESVVYEDCHVDATTVTNYCMALQLPHTSAVDIPADTGSSFYGVIRKLNFTRCTFKLRYMDVGETVMSPFVTGTGAEEVNVEDTSFDMTASILGSGRTPNPPAMAVWSTNEGRTGEPGFGADVFDLRSSLSKVYWGAVAFISRRVNVRNVRMTNALRVSLYGDMAFFYGNLTIDGLRISYNETTAGSGSLLPYTRVATSEVRNAGGSHSTVWPGFGLPSGSSLRNTASIRNVSFDVFELPAANYWTRDIGAMLFSFGKYVDIDKVTYLNATEAGAPPSGGGGGVFVGSLDSTGSVTGTSDCRIRNCNIRNARYGIRYTDVNYSAGAQISDNYIQNTTYYAIKVEAPYFAAAPVVGWWTVSQFDGVRVQNNTVVDAQCVNGVTTPVMIMVPAVGGFGLGKQSVVSGNNISIITSTGSAGMSVIASYQGSSSVPAGIRPPNVSMFGNAVVMNQVGVISAGYISVVGWDSATSSHKQMPGWNVKRIDTSFKGFETEYMPLDTPLVTTLMTGVTLPAANVVTTTDLVTDGWPSNGQFAIGATATSSGQVVNYSGISTTNTANDTFTSCTEGYGSFVGVVPGPAAYIHSIGTQKCNYVSGAPMIHNYAVLKNNGSM